MSVVTNVVIHVDYAPRAVHEQLLEPLPFDVRTQSFERVNPYVVGGHKALESDVYIAAFNHLDITEFQWWFSHLPWDRVSQAHLSVFGEDGYEYTDGVSPETKDKSWAL